MRFPRAADREFTISPTMMTHLTLIVPFSVPPGAGDDASDEVVPGALLRQLELPGLGKLLTRATPGPRERHGADFDPTALRSVPHERWLARRAGLDAVRVPSAPFMRLADGGAPDDQAWTCLQPVHIHAARDHLVMLHPAQLAVQPDEARALHDAVAPLLAETDIVIEALDPARWYLPEAVFGPLDATPPLRVTGRNIDIWMQEGPRARDWRRVQNEIQMTWYDHPVNAAREAGGKLSINSVWVHGGGKLQPVPRLADTVMTADAFLRGLGLAGGAACLPVPERLDHATTSGSAMAMLDTAVEAHIGQDWYAWIQHMHKLDADWFTPALEALSAGSLQALTLVLSGDNHYAEFTVTRADLRKFWRGFGARGDWRSLLSDLALTV